MHHSIKIAKSDRSNKAKEELRLLTSYHKVGYSDLIIAALIIALKYPRIKEKMINIARDEKKGRLKNDKRTARKA
jgi:hypothetical protein